MRSFAQELGLQLTLGSQFNKPLHIPAELKPLIPDEMTESNKEQYLLQLLSAWTLYQDAGFQPVTLQPSALSTEQLPDVIPAADSESQQFPVMAESLQQVFKRYFAEKSERQGLNFPKTLWAYWIQATWQQSAQVPNALLVDFLSAIYSYQRRDVLHLLSSRALWLGQHNPEWQWTAAAQPISLDATGQLDAATQQQWLSADKSVRVLLLQRLRQLDPLLGLQQLQQVWSSIDAEQRESLIQCLAPQLSEQDTEFLQQVLLTDRSRVVKHSAAYLLSRLPHSDFYQQLTDLFKQSVSLTDLQPGVDIELSESVLKQLKEQSLEAKGTKLLSGNQQKSGEKAQTIAFLCSLFPLDCWSQLIPDLEQAFIAITKSIWADSMLAGLRFAIVNQQRQDWATALFQSQQDALIHYDDTDGQSQLLALLSPEQCENIMLLQCQNFKSGHYQDSTRQLWDQLFAEHIRQVKNQDDLNPYNLAQGFISERLADECLTFIQGYSKYAHTCEWLKDFLALCASPQWLHRHLSHFEASELTLWQIRQQLTQLGHKPD